MKWTFLAIALAMIGCGTPQSFNQNATSALTASSRSDNEDAALKHLNMAFEYSKQKTSPKTQQTLKELQVIMQGIGQ